MAGRYKGKTIAAQVAIRSDRRKDAEVLTRIANGSEIEVGITPTSADGTKWRQVAYAYKKHGYIMDTYITVTDKTAKYYMYDTLSSFGDQIYVRGNSDKSSSSGDIHNIQTALNKLADKVKKNSTGTLPTIVVDGIFGPNTETAVKKAQSYMGCTADGKVGPHTKARLYYCAYDQGGWPLAENA